MAIRRRFNRPGRIWYHVHYGSVEVPPAVDMGSSGKVWPNGSAVTSPNVSGIRGVPSVIGWICEQRGINKLGMWISTVKGQVAACPYGTPRVIKGKRVPQIDITKCVDGSYKYVGSIPDTTPRYRAMEKLIDEFAEFHDIIM